MPLKEKNKQEELHPNLQLAVDALNANCPWLKQSLGEKWFLEFSKGLRFFVETHDNIVDYAAVCDLLNKNRIAIGNATQLLCDLEVGKNHVRRFDDDPELRRMLLSLVSASTVIAKVYHIDPVVYLATLSLECPGDMKTFYDQMASQDRLKKESDKKHSKTGKGAFQLTYNCFPRLLINNEVLDWQIQRFQEYLIKFNTNANLAALQQDIDFSNRTFLHENPFANALGSTLTMYWFLFSAHVNKAKKGGSFGPEDMYKNPGARKEISEKYNGGDEKENYSKKFMERYEYFKDALSPVPFTADWQPKIVKL